MNSGAHKMVPEITAVGQSKCAPSPPHTDNHHFILLFPESRGEYGKLLCWWELLNILAGNDYNTMLYGVDK